jgi:hypothetical protein
MAVNGTNTANSKVVSLTPKVECPSVQVPDVGFIHEPCTRARCTWWNERCTAKDTVPIGRLRRRIKCALASRCRWALESSRGICPPMTHGTVCEHQGGDFNTFDFEES